MTDHGTPPNGGSHPARDEPVRHLDNPLARKLACLTRLSEADRYALAGAFGPVRRVGARTAIVAEGDDPTVVHVVLDGWACRTRQLADGRRQIVALLLPGDSCDPHVFRLSRRDHGIEALTSVVLAQIPGGAIREVSARRPALERAFHLDALVDAAIQREWTVSLGRRTGIERLAHLFCEIQARLAAVGLVEGGSCPMPVIQADLADALGQTAVHLNRVLRELRGQGLIDLRNRRLTVHDPVALADLACFDPAYLHQVEGFGPPYEHRPHGPPALR